ncbi:LANO_0H24872g1_1 [Lachancea nothofagi CBS 11611]|uniref:LANO_0H24872g1_1 n=1 Tax=Lachancea nothofagi CBS 11611 TaxID=1266666 RepID=A0A1G4KNV0_9SACH|nr:LANO_0H24872g1_1 [Lachancea nothofagi CBS 11611]
MTFIGKAIHFSVDLTLVSLCLAGVKRNTGLTPKLDSIEDTHIRGYVHKYLNIGESCYDYTVASLGSSRYFARK